MLPLIEGTKDRKTAFTALFGMELHSCDIVLCNGCRNLYSVFGGCKKAVLTAVGIIGMNEIDVVAFLCVFEYGMRCLDVQGVPADLRYFSAPAEDFLPSE